MKSVVFFLLLICPLASIAADDIAKQVQILRHGLAFTYDQVQKLKTTDPIVAAAYLKGIAEATFIFRVVNENTYTFCTPQGTRIDAELIELVAANEVRLHGGDPANWYHELVKQGIKRAFPCQN